MEQQDNFCFFQGFQSKRQHAGLNHKCRKEEKVVARERSTARVPQMRTDN